MLTRYEALEDSYLIRRLRAIVGSAFDGTFSDDHGQDLNRMLDFADEKLALYADPLPGTEDFFGHATRAYERLLDSLELIMSGLCSEDSRSVEHGLAQAEECEIELQGLSLDVRRERNLALI
jgi:hypothetical protein